MAITSTVMIEEPGVPSMRLPASCAEATWWWRQLSSRSRSEVRAVWAPLGRRGGFGARGLGFMGVALRAMVALLAIGDQLAFAQRQQPVLVTRDE